MLFTSILAVYLLSDEYAQHKIPWGRLFLQSRTGNIIPFLQQKSIIPGRTVTCICRLSQSVAEYYRTATRNNNYSTNAAVLVDHESLPYDGVRGSVDTHLKRGSVVSGRKGKRDRPLKKLQPCRRFAYWRTAAKTTPQPAVAKGWSREILFRKRLPKFSLGSCHPQKCNA